MMLDVLSTLPEIQVCVAYELGGRRVVDFPSHVDDLRRAVPIYESWPGWSEDVSEIDRAAELPQNAQAYIARIGQLVGRPVGVVSVGPDRAQTIFLDPQLATRFSRFVGRS
jgi:adenylosuccinate synthase